MVGQARVAEELQSQGQAPEAGTADQPLLDEAGAQAALDNAVSQLDAEAAEAPGGDVDEAPAAEEGLPPDGEEAAAATDEAGGEAPAEVDEAAGAEEAAGEEAEPAAAEEAAGDGGKGAATAAEPMPKVERPPKPPEPKKVDVQNFKDWIQVP